MSFYGSIVCSQCERSASCTHPCEKYSDEVCKVYLETQRENIQNTIKILDFEKNSLCTESYNPLVPTVSGFIKYDKTAVSMDCENEEKFDDFMDDFFEYDVDQPEYLQVCNGLVMPSKVINWSSVLDYMKERNRIYSEESGLCEVCHSELIEKKEHRGEHFGSPSYESVIVCPRCG